MANMRFRGKKRRGRKSLRLPPKPLVMIVCEGGKTEPEYFNGFRISRRMNRKRIRLITSKDCGGNDPRTIVRCAKRMRRELLKDEGLYYETVWCVFDRDQHTTYNQAINQAHANNFDVAFSNPCFELWYLLHFRPQNAHSTCDEVLHQLRQPNCIPNYEEGMENLFNTLINLQREAIRRAQVLRHIHRHNYMPESTNPSTTVDILIEFLNGIKQ